MYAKITRDLIWSPGDTFKNRQNVTIIGEERAVADPNCLRVRLLDDDRTPYYEAIADDEALEPLFEWAMRDSGVTILQVREGNGWVDTIS